MEKEPSLHEGYTRVANELFEAILLTDLAGRKLRVFLAIMRETYGWNRKTAQISYARLSELTGIKWRHHVVKVVDELVKDGLVLREKSSRGNAYEINKRYQSWNSYPGFRYSQNETDVTQDGNRGVTQECNRAVTQDGNRGVTQECNRGVTQECNRGVTQDGNRGVTQECNRGVTQECNRGVTQDGNRGVTQECNRSVTQECNSSGPKVHGLMLVSSDLKTVKDNIKKGKDSNALSTFNNFDKTEIDELRNALGKIQVYPMDMEVWKNLKGLGCTVFDVECARKKRGKNRLEWIADTVCECRDSRLSREAAEKPVDWKEEMKRQGITNVG